jgi:hypothetical protein
MKHALAMRIAKRMGSLPAAGKLPLEPAMEFRGHAGRTPNPDFQKRAAGRHRRLRLLLRPLAPGEFDLDVALLAGSLSLGAAVLLWHGAGLPWPRCWLRTLTGLPCPFCGATHAGLALLHGDALAAIRINPLASFVYAAIGFYDLHVAVILLAAGHRRLRLDGLDQQREKVLLLAGLLLVMMNWAYLLVRGWH